MENPIHKFEYDEENVLPIKGTKGEPCIIHVQYQDIIEINTPVTLKYKWTDSLGNYTEPKSLQSGKNSIQVPYHYILLDIVSEEETKIKITISREKINVGDWVIHFSNQDRTMHVDSISDGVATCSWTQGDKTKTQKYPVTALEKDNRFGKPSPVLLM